MSKLILYFNQPQTTPSSHLGLGVNALHTVKALQDNNIRCLSYPVRSDQDVLDRIATLPDTTACIIEAPWMSPKNVESMIFKYPDIHFYIRYHSQVGFLQVEARAIDLIQQYLVLQDHSHNFHIAGNSRRFCSFIEEAYRGDCFYLPNLYYYTRPDNIKVRTIGDTLRVGIFGATRLLKNQLTSLAASMLIARRLGVNLEAYINNSRQEYGVGVIDCMRNLVKNMVWAKLIELPWQQWSLFRNTIDHMHLVLQPSYTETFNLVTADAVAEGVPVVTSSAIDWIPSYWYANVDDADDVARVGLNLLNNPNAVKDGQAALKKYMDDSLVVWKGI